MIVRSVVVSSQSAHLLLEQNTYIKLLQLQKQLVSEASCYVYSERTAMMGRSTPNEHVYLSYKSNVFTTFTCFASNKEKINLSITYRRSKNSCFVINV